MSYNLGTAQGTIRLEYDSRGVLRARDDLGRFVSLSEVFGDQVDRDTRKASKAWDGFGVSLAKAAKIMAAVALAASALQNVIGGVVLVTQSLIPIIQATLATLPALILTAVSALIVLKAAFAGVGDAIKAAFSQDIDKFNESLKKLAPSAQEFAKALFEVVKQAKPLQQALQQQLFAGLAPEVANLTRLFALIRPQAEAAAAGFGAVLKEVIKFASTPDFIGAVGASLEFLGKALQLIAPAMQPFLAGFSILAERVAPIIETFGNDLGNMLARFGSFMAQLNVEALFDRAGAAIGGLADLFSGLFSILGSIGEAFTGTGNAIEGVIQPASSVSTALSGLVTKIAEFLNSAEGSSALNALATAMTAVATAGGDVLLSLLSALAPAITAIAPTVTVLARVLGAVLSNAFETLAPVVLQVAQALNASLGPILPTLMDALNALLPPLGRVAAVFGGVLAQALTVIAPLISKIAPIISEVLVRAIEALLPNLERWGETWIQLSNELLPAVIPLLEQIAPLLIQLAPLIASSANMFLTLLIPAMKLFVPVAAFFINMTTQVIAALSGLIRWIISVYTSVASNWDGVRNVTANAFGAVGNLISTAMNLARTAVSNAIANIRGVINTLSGIPAQVGGYFRAMATAAQNAIGSLLGVVRGIPGQVRGALGNLAGLLQSAGSDLIQGLINGIRNMASAAIQAARNVAAQVAGAVKGALGISSPSKVMMEFGQETSIGLAKGILAASRRVEDAMLQVAGLIPSSIAFDSRTAMLAAAGLFGGGGTAPAATEPTGQPQVVINQTVNPSAGMNEQELANEALRRLAFGVQTGTSNIVPGVA